MQVQGSGSGTDNSKSSGADIVEDFILFFHIYVNIIYESGRESRELLALAQATWWPKMMSSLSNSFVVFWFAPLRAL